MEDEKTTEITWTSTDTIDLNLCATDETFHPGRIRDSFADRALYRIVPHTAK